MREPVRVELVGYPCPCPGSPHALEWVDLEPEVTIPMGMAAMYVVISMVDTASEADLRGALAPVLVRFGIREWSFREGSRTVKVEPDAVARLLPFAEAGFEVADKCMDLYLADIIRPLAARRDRLSGTGPKADSTSASPISGTPPQTPSSPSSPESMDGSLYGDQV
jgi:hypothetical protein